MDKVHQLRDMPCSFEPVRTYYPVILHDSLDQKICFFSVLDNIIKTPSALVLLQSQAVFF